jgi:hypothetical protein
MDVMEVPDTVPVLIGQLPLQRPSPSALWPVSDRATRPTEGLQYRGRPSVSGFGGVRDPRRARPALWPVSDRATRPTEGLPYRGRPSVGQLRQGQTRDSGFQRKARSIEATFLARSGFLSVARLPR